MSGTAEIKGRIGSVEETRKITNAMYLIASTKLQRARNDLEKTRPYFDALRNEIKRIFRTVNDVDSPYFYPPYREPKIEGTYGCLVITADKGLAGAYNQNVIKETEELLKEHEDTQLFVVGEYGRHFFTKNHIPIEHTFLYTAQNPTMDRAREISSLLLEKYDRGELRKIYIIYTDMEDSMTMVAKRTRLLPFHRAHFSTPAHEKVVSTPFEFLPSVTDVLNSVIPSYLSGFIYSTLIDSFCSEQNARMTAMNAANQNAEELLEMLAVQYNQIRQAEITQEITEVTAGAKAQKRKRKRRQQKKQRKEV